ncbi:MAG: adenylyltransferase/cytidyltransferase family protein [Phycisphaerae bacterium]|nr:adenylyltransferase/cytidyltransferase family protein [Phycisphaerae bacterium]
MASYKDKILTLSDLTKKIRTLKQDGKVVVQSHGVFDLIHPGIVRHLDEAKQLGDVLVVTVIRDEDVHRSPGRPVFPGQMRADNVASLQQVDYVCLVNDEEPFVCVKQIQPNIFAKGQAYHERDRKIHEKIFQQEREFYLGKCRIMETEGFDFSDSHLMDKLVGIYPPETKPFLDRFGQEHGFSEIADAINALSGMKVMVIGDGIVDEYHYCQSLGKSAKANLVVSRYLNHETFAGGAFVVANHVAGLCGHVKLVSSLGDRDRREEFVNSALKPNVQPRFFTKPASDTIVKKRYLDDYRKQKLFEICYLNDEPITGSIEREVIEYLRDEIPKYDLVMISDFGHGFITQAVMDTVSTCARHWAANAQTNASNRGYNLITKYHGPDYACMDETELRLAAQAKYEPIEDIAARTRNDIRAKRLIVTIGKKGSVGVDSSGEINRTPILCDKVVDTVGAGDAFFACTSPCGANGVPLDVLSFIGNAAGAIAVQVVCNKKSIERFELLEFIHALLK